MPDAANTSIKKSQQPESLAEFAESARSKNPHGEKKPLTATARTAPVAAKNQVKHEVASNLLNSGAHGLHPNPHSEGVDKLPDRIFNSRRSQSWVRRFFSRWSGSKPD